MSAPAPPPGRWAAPGLPLTCRSWAIHPSLLAWEFAGAVCALAAAGYVLTRSVPVPGDAADAGNWLEPLGVASLTIEAVVVILAMTILAGIYRISYASRPWVRAFSTD